MKKALLTVVALSVSVSLFAQGTVTFSNIGGNRNVQFDENNDGVGDRNLAAADGVQVSLWFAPAGTTDTGASAWQMVGAPANIISPGLFSGGTRTVPGATEGTRYAFQVRAWETAVYGTTAAGWDAANNAAVAHKVSTGSAVVDAGTGGWGTPPGVAVSLAPLWQTGSGSFVVASVPEPSVLALGVLGVGALLMLRRRK
jgi:MYXO-CTERM domain-containing protein